MHAHHPTLGHENIRVNIVHPMTKYNRLGFEFNQLGLYVNEIAGNQFFKVLEMLFNGYQSPLFIFQVSRCKSEVSKEMPSAFIKLTDIMHDVHMTIEITMPWIDRSPV